MAPTFKDLLQQEFACRLSRHSQGGQRRRYQRLLFSLSWIFNCSLVSEHAAPRRAALCREVSAVLPCETGERRRAWLGVMCQLPLFVKNSKAFLMCFMGSLCVLCPKSQQFAITACCPLYLLLKRAKVLFVLAAPPTSKKPQSHVYELTVNTVLNIYN